MDGVRADSELETAVAEGSDVGVHTTDRTGLRGNRQILVEEQTVRCTAVVFNRSGDVLEDREVGTDVELLVLLPLELRVRESGRTQTGDRRNRRACIIFRSLLPFS